MVAYDRDTLHRASDELAQLGPDPALGRLMADYAVMRNQARACGGAGRD